MYYEHVLREHRQRVARGVENYERQRVAAERASENVAAQEVDESDQECEGEASRNRDTSELSVVAALALSDR